MTTGNQPTPVSHDGMREALQKIISCKEIHDILSEDYPMFLEDAQTALASKPTVQVQEVSGELVEALKFYRDNWQTNAEGDFSEPGLSRSWQEPNDALWQDAGRKAERVLATIQPPKADTTDSEGA